MKNRTKYDRIQSINGELVDYSDEIKFQKEDISYFTIIGFIVGAFYLGYKIGSFIFGL